MEKGDRREPEETMQEGLQIQDPEVCHEGLQSDQQSQKSGDPAQNEATKLGVTHETQKLMQQEKAEPAQKVKTQDSLQKSEEEASSRQECRELAKDEELEQKTDANIVVQQKDESSFAPKQDSSQTNQPEDDTIHQECDVFAEDKLLESDGNTTMQRTAETPESVLLVPDQESIQITQQEDNNATHQVCDRSVEDESLKPKFKTNLTEQLKEETLEESSNVSIEHPLQTTEQEANDAVQQECDRTTENGHFEESENGPESEEFHLVCLRTRELEEVASLPLPSRICYHRTRIMQRPRLPPVPEEPDLEEEILVRRNRRTLGARLPTLPTGIRDYMQRVRERHIPPERQALCEELQRRCVKLLYSLVISGLLVVVLYFLIDYLESKYDTNSQSNVTSPLPDISVNLNIPVIAFKPDTSVTDLDANISTSMVDLDINTINSVADFDTEVSLVLNDMNVNGTNPVNDLE